MSEPPDFDQIASYEQDCGLLRIQALGYGETMMDRVDAELGVATRHIERIYAGQLTLVPAVAREITTSIERARVLLGIGAGWREVDA